MKVYINDSKDKTKRQVVEAKLIKENKLTVVVELPDGNVITRKKSRDIPK
jgi:hypothetical protein